MTREHGVRNGGVARRTLLRGLAAAGAVGGVSTTATAGMHQNGPCGDIIVDPDANTGDYSSIQAAIDAASPGETICVHSGTYAENPDVNTAVTLTSNETPGSDGAAVVDGQIAVSAAGATVSLLEVTRSGTITPGGLDPAGILVTASDVTIDTNLVQGLAADSTDGSVTINGIQVWHAGSTPLSGVTVQNNAVGGFTNDADPSSWPYGGSAGIKVQGVVDGVEVLDNTVNHVYSAGWAYGITTTHTGNAPGVSPKNVTVEGNDVSNVNNGVDDPSAAPYPGSCFIVDGDADADEMTVQFNNFTKTPFGVFTKDPEGTLDAECNWWGHATGPSTDDNPVGQGTAIGHPDDEDEYGVDYRPWSVREFTGQLPKGATCRGDVPDVPNVTE